MLRAFCSTRSGFTLLVALLAATVGDYVVEGISNAHLFWRGRYTDGSSADLVPMAIVVAVAFSLAVVFGALRRLDLTDASGARAARPLSMRTVAKLLPSIFALQLLALDAMETAEQLVVYGHAFGGAVWLGGPVWFALAAHAAIGAFSAFALAALLGACSCGLARAVRYAFAATGRSGRPRAIRLLRPTPECVAAAALRAPNCAGRAPPLSPQSS